MFMLTNFCRTVVRQSTLIALYVGPSFPNYLGILNIRQRFTMATEILTGGLNLAFARYGDRSVPSSVCVLIL